SNYVASLSTGVPMEDIRNNGTFVNGLSDEGVLQYSMAAPPLPELAFSFSYFGQPQTNVTIASNGFIEFGGAINSFTAQTMPSATTPNGVVAPLWRDLDFNAVNPQTNPTTACNVAVRGTAPNRRMIVQWTNVSQYNGGSTTRIDA